MSATSDATFTLSVDMCEKYKEILRSNGIMDEVAQVVRKDTGLMGEGLASQTHLITVIFKNPLKKPLNLFVKTETTNESHSEFLRDTKLFEKEAVFFMKYIPSAEQFLLRLGEEELLKIYPKCYFGDSKMIVLENLMDRGYELLDKAEQQDFDTAKLALSTLAKHHAVSFALLMELGGPEMFFKEFPGFDFESLSNSSMQAIMEPLMEDAIRINIELLEKSSAEAKDLAIDLLRSKVGKSWECATNALKLHKEDGTVQLLNHNDYWNNNQMFLRDKETNKMKDCIAIDFQAVGYDSPARDLGYYFFCSVKPEVRRKHTKDLLRFYLEVLNATTSKLGHPVNMTFDQLFQSYRTKFEFGFWFCGILVTTKAAFLVKKDFDISQIEVTDFPAVFSKRIREWIEKNPEASEEDAVAVAKLMMEYKDLTIN